MIVYKAKIKMDYQGRSIQSGTADPAVLEAIVALQQEVVAINGEIGFLQTESNTQEDQISIVQGQILSIQTNVTQLQDDAKTQAGQITSLGSDVTTLQDDEKKIQADVTQLQSQVATLGSEVTTLLTAVQTLQSAPSIADCGSLVLTCPVSTDTATLRVTVAADWDNFYYTGYSPAGSPFTLTQFVAVNFQTLEGFNPIGLYWTDPLE